MTITISSGVTSTGLTISSGDPLVVLSGGEVEDSNVLGGGSVTLSSGGIGSYLILSSGAVLQGPGEIIGEVYVEPAASASDVVVAIGEIVDLGSIADVIVESGGGAWIDDDASNITVQSGGSEYVFEGGVVSGTDLSGLEVISGGGEAFADTVHSGAVEIDAGVVSGTMVLSGGVEQLTSGGVASGTTISTGGVAYISSGGVASGAIVDGGALLLISSGGGAPGARVRNGGTIGFGADVTSDFTAGMVTSTTVVSGATVASGGIVDLYGATVLSGATASVTAGTVASVLRVDPGGVVSGPGELAGVTYDFGSVSGVTLPGSYLLVEFGGSSSDVTVQSGAVAYDYGDTSGATVSSGGIEAIGPGGAESGTIALSGALEYILSRGSASGDTIESGALLVVQADATASDVTVQSGARLDFEGNVTTSITVGRVASTTLVGGVTVSSGGGIELFGATVLSGAADTILYGGVADGTTVLSGGQEIVSSGGVAFSTVVSGGGTETIASGALAVGLTVLREGVAAVDGEALFAGPATLSGTLEGSGVVAQDGPGAALVLGGSGAGFSGVAAIRGGTIELASSGALGTGYVEFAEPATGSAVLQIDAADAPAAGGTFANTIYDFSGANDDIDLRSIAYVAGATATVSGTTLVLVDGGQTYKFNLEGSIAGAYPVLRDGSGGTLIDPPAPDPAVARFTQAAAAFAPSGAGKTALVSSTSPVGQSPFLHTAASAGHG
jgi:autotransporter passenger strand-loop-strand repeat protein